MTKHEFRKMLEEQMELLSELAKKTDNIEELCKINDHIQRTIYTLTELVERRVDPGLEYGACVVLDHEPTREEVVDRLAQELSQTYCRNMIRDAYDKGKLVIKPQYGDHGWTAAIRFVI